jgi:MFS family permease
MPAKEVSPMDESVLPAINRTSGRGAPVSAAPTERARRAVWGGIFGNYADQFDIFLPVIALGPAALVLFGSANVAAGAGWVFVATLLGRPLGAAIFGPIADRFGRTTTTRVVLIGVAVTTLLIAVVPGHAVLGQGTLLVVIALRFVGGVFLGGEYTSAVPLALEWSVPTRRGFVSGLIMAMSPLANATIAALVFVLLSALGPVAYAGWGWRVLFVIGALIALGIRLYYRRGIQDAPRSGESSGENAGRANPLKEVVLGEHRRVLAQVFVLMTGLWLLTDMAVPVLTTALGTASALDPRSISLIVLGATIVSAFGIVAAGRLSSRTGRRVFFVGFGIAAAAFAPMVFLSVFKVSGLGLITVLAAVLQLVTVSGYGPVGAYLAERFPAAVRSTGYGIAYSLSIVLPALYPYYLPALQAWMGRDTPIVLLLILGGVLVATGGLAGPETKRVAQLS